MNEEIKEEEKYIGEEYYHDEYKNDMYSKGLLLAILFGPLAFIAAIASYPQKTKARFTFSKGATTGIIINLVIFIIISCILIGTSGSLVSQNEKTRMVNPDEVKTFSSFSVIVSNGLELNDSNIDNLIILNDIKDKKIKKKLHISSVSSWNYNEKEYRISVTDLNDEYNDIYIISIKNKNIKFSEYPNKDELFFKLR